jgi:hypothetical protein
MRVVARNDNPTHLERGEEGVFFASRPLGVLTLLRVLADAL